MAVFGLVLVIFGISTAGLAIGVIFGRAPIQRTCGGGTCSKTFECSGCNQQKTKGQEQ